MSVACLHLPYLVGTSFHSASVPWLFIICPVFPNECCFSSLILIPSQSCLSFLQELEAAVEEELLAENIMWMQPGS